MRGLGLWVGGCDKSLAGKWWGVWELQEGCTILIANGGYTVRI